MVLHSRQTCRFFARGKCDYGTSCKYRHSLVRDEDNTQAVRTSGSRVCIYYQTGRCYKGDACRFAHEGKALSSSSSSAQDLQTAKPKSVPDEDEQTFLTWQRDVPGMRRGPPRALGTVGMSKFFLTAWEMISRNSATTQRVVTTLATEGGLARIDELSRIDIDRLTAEGKVSCLEKLMVPFLRAISDKCVLSSFVLEDAVGTIYNFLYGVNGRRGIPFYNSISAVLLTAKLDVELDKELLGVSISATLATLHQMLVCNQTASIEDGISEIIETISEYTSELIDDSQADLNMQTAFRHLEKIRTRLRFGNEIPLPTDSKHTTTTGLAIFDVGQEWPGNRSPDGPRHDNDHENISDIKILPTPGEIQSHRLEYLPVTDPGKLHLQGVRGLLDRHFRLLREDTVGQLRDCVRLIIQDLADPTFEPSGNRRAMHGAQVFVYNHVSISEIAFDERKGLQVLIEFEQPPGARALSEEEARKTWWAETKQLQQDSLLCLVDSNGRSVFFSVSDREGRKDVQNERDIVDDAGKCTLGYFPSQKCLLKCGIPGLSRDGNLPIKQTLQGLGSGQPINLWNDRQMSLISVRLLEETDDDMFGILERYRTNPHARQALVEFPGVIVPSFRPTLQALQLMSRSLDIPFSEYLAPAATMPATSGTVAEIPAPQYALVRGFQFDLSSITNGAFLKLSPQERFDVTSLESNSTLDLAQCNALVSALTRSLALIQGPPGTGKSYVAVQLVKILLAHREIADLGPIICV